MAYLAKPCVGLGLLSIVLLLPATAGACAVPVHRYLLVRWERELYQAYYFYRGEQGMADRQVNEFLENVASSFESHVNLSFRSVDVDGLADNPLLGRELEIWNEHKLDKLPFHLVLSPIGNSLFRGRLDLATASAMIESPARTQLARQLCTGKGGVLLLLTGDDKKENETAEKDVRWVLGRAKKEHGLDVGFLRVSRKNPREKWLIRSLLDSGGIPPDDMQCVVFGICGRGRVLAGCIGEGINRRNIIECVYLMNGDCSCDLRFAGPGMDLLTDWDWEGAIADLPLMTEEPLRSVLLGFDDSDEGSPATPSQEEGMPRNVSRSVLRTRSFARWGVAFGIASVVVVGIGLMIFIRRKEV